jgi:hypothetical protein
LRRPPADSGGIDCRTLVMVGGDDEVRLEQADDPRLPRARGRADPRPHPPPRHGGTMKPIVAGYL